MGLMLKRLASFFIFALFIFVFVSGYTRSNGTYVNSYYRSRPNAYTFDNYTYRPSQNLYNPSYYSTSRTYTSRYYTPSYYDSDWSSGIQYNSTYNNSRYSYWDY
jgi:hypothetical protein